MVLQSQVVNYATGKPNVSRKNRVKSMLAQKKPFESRVEASVMNRILMSPLFSNTKLPVGSLKKTTMGGKQNNVTNYQLRALNMLSQRSMGTAKANVKTLKNRKNKKVLSQALQMSKRNTRRQRK